MDYMDASHRIRNESEIYAFPQDVRCYQRHRSGISLGNTRSNIGGGNVRSDHHSGGSQGVYIVDERPDRKRQMHSRLWRQQTPRSRHLPEPKRWRREVGDHRSLGNPRADLVCDLLRHRHGVLHQL